MKRIPSLVVKICLMAFFSLLCPFISLCPSNTFPPLNTLCTWDCLLTHWHDASLFPEASHTVGMSDLQRTCLLCGIYLPEAAVHLDATSSMSVKAEEEGRAGSRRRVRAQDSWIDCSRQLLSFTSNGWEHVVELDCTSVEALEESNTTYNIMHCWNHIQSSLVWF